MAGGRNNTLRIETLENQASTLSARLDVCGIQIDGLTEGFKKAAETAERHVSAITVIEQQLLVLADLKNSLAEITAIRLEIVTLKKDVESIEKWKEDQKKEKDETSRRLWAFGPSLVGAVVSGIISLVVAVLVVWLNKTK